MPYKKQKAASTAIPQPPTTKCVLCFSYTGLRSGLVRALAAEDPKTSAGIKEEISRVQQDICSLGLAVPDVEHTLTMLGVPAQVRLASATEVTAEQVAALRYTVEKVATDPELKNIAAGKCIVRVSLNKLPKRVQTLVDAMLAQPNWSPQPVRKRIASDALKNTDASQVLGQSDAVLAAKSGSGHLPENWVALTSVSIIPPYQKQTAGIALANDQAQETGNRAHGPFALSALSTQNRIQSASLEPVAPQHPQSETTPTPSGVSTLIQASAASQENNGGAAPIAYPDNSAGLESTLQALQVALAAERRLRETFQRSMELELAAHKNTETALQEERMAHERAEAACEAEKEKRVRLEAALKEVWRTCQGELYGGDGQRDIQNTVRGSSEGDNDAARPPETRKRGLQDVAEEGQRKRTRGEDSLNMVRY